MASLTIPTLEEIERDMATAQRAEIDSALDTSAESPNGQMSQIFSSHAREIWESIGQAYDLDPETQEGDRLDWVCAFTGTFRRGATPSRFTGARRIRVNLDAGATLPAGSVAHVDGSPDIRFATSEDVTNTDILAANVFVSAVAENVGPTICNAGTLTVIATPVVGWNAVDNPTDCELGRLQERDPELRDRRRAELRRPGASAVDAISVDLRSLRYEGEFPILQADVLENTGTWMDARGVPGKAIECLIWEPAQQAPDNVIAQVIWDGKPAGIRAFGMSSGIALDRSGRQHTIHFTRPTIFAFGIEIIAVKNPLTYAGDDVFRVTIADGMKALARAEMLVRFSDVVRLAHKVPGIVAVTHVRLADFTFPAFTDYPMPLRTFPLFDSSSIVAQVDEL